MKLTKEKLKKLSDSINFIFDENTIFIETGTHYGDTILEIQELFKNIHTIEIVPRLYERFKSLNTLDSVHCYLGDSSNLLQSIINKSIQKTIFWLDGHYVNSLEKISPIDVPLLEELKIINSEQVGEALVLIDDVRLFDTSHYENWTGITEKNLLNILKDRIVDHKILDDVLIIKISDII